MANATPRQARTQSAQPSARGQSVTSRALALLGAFDSEHPRLTLSEMSRRAGLPVATAHRLIAELQDWGALHRSGQEYFIGHRLWQLGLLAPTHQNFAELAAPYMQDVLFVTQNVVNLFILDGHQVLLLERMSGTRVGAPFRRVGDHLPLHASAAGKVMMAFGEPELLEVGLEHLSRLTDRTITSPSKLRTEVSRARENGYATTHGEAGSRNYGIAVPVMSLTGRCVAALGVVTLERPASVGAVVPVLRIAARSIARRIGTSMAN